MNWFNLCFDEKCLMGPNAAKEKIRTVGVDSAITHEKQESG
jgi:hypothetical protein